MNTAKNAPQPINVTHVGMIQINQPMIAGKPVVQGEPVKPIVIQCRPPSKIGCVIAGAPAPQGEAVKSITQPARQEPCGEIYTAESGAPDISLMFAVLIAGIFGNCR